MVKKKGKSKRQTLKQKYKIERRVKEHHRRLKKEANRATKNGVRPKKRKAKDPGIPNEWPYKEELLKEIERAKEAMEKRKEEQKAARKEARRTALEERRQKVMEGDISSMAEQAEARAQTFNAAAAVAEETQKSQAPTAKHGQQSRRAFLRELRKVVESSDVILEVLDARDPAGSRAAAIEAAIASNPRKRLVLVLNKVDLVPKEVASGWLAFLRRSHPTVAFKASTQEGAISHARGADAHAEAVDDETLQKSAAVGVEALMNVLKNYSRSLDTKTSISVGVIGYPNTGKSSIINSLKRSKAVGTSSTAGFTKAMQEVVLDKQIRLLDCPGIVFDDSDGDGTLLRNCVDPDTLEDPEGAVQAILKRCSTQQLMMTYSLPRFPKGDVGAFLGLVARTRGKVKKGGIPDKASAARHVLRDWNSGKVKYYTKPPSDDAHLVPGGATIVSKFSETLQPDALPDQNSMMNDDDSVLQQLPDANPMDFLSFNSNEPSTTQGFEAASAILNGEEEDSENEMEDESNSEDNDDDDEEEAPTLVSTSRRPDPLAEDKEANPGMGNDSRRSQKATLKKNKKAARRQKQLPMDHEAEDEGDDYDFSAM